jgi:hypothetical protein
MSNSDETSSAPVQPTLNANAVWLAARKSAEKKKSPEIMWTKHEDSKAQTTPTLTSIVDNLKNEKYKNVTVLLSPAYGTQLNEEATQNLTTELGLQNLEDAFISPEEHMNALMKITHDHFAVQAERAPSPSHNLVNYLFAKKQLFLCISLDILGVDKKLLHHRMDENDLLQFEGNIEESTCSSYKCGISIKPEAFGGIILMYTP